MIWSCLSEEANERGCLFGFIEVVCCVAGCLFGVRPTLNLAFSHLILHVSYTVFVNIISTTGSRASLEMDSLVMFWQRVGRVMF